MTNYFPTMQAMNLSYNFYEPQKVILGKTMAEHLRIAVCYWHTFCWHGEDPFGLGTRILPWDHADNPLQAAEKKLDAAFEFFTKLNIPFFSFHDRFSP
jgi:xylose isomerase